MKIVFSLLQQEIWDQISRLYFKKLRRIIVNQSFLLFFIPFKLAISLTWYSKMTNGSWEYQLGECLPEPFFMHASLQPTSSNSNIILKLHLWLYIPQYYTRYYFQWISLFIFYVILTISLRPYWPYTSYQSPWCQKIPTLERPYQNILAVPSRHIPIQQNTAVSLVKQILPSRSKATTSASTSVTPTNKVYRNLFPLLQSTKSSYVQYRTLSLFILGVAFVSLAKRSHMQKTVPCFHTQLSIHYNSEFLPVL